MLSPMAARFYPGIDLVSLVLWKSSRGKGSWLSGRGITVMGCSSSWNFHSSKLSILLRLISLLYVWMFTSSYDTCGPRSNPRCRRSDNFFCVVWGSNLPELELWVKKRKNRRVLTS